MARRVCDIPYVSRPAEEVDAAASNGRCSRNRRGLDVCVMQCPEFPPLRALHVHSTHHATVSGDG